MAMSQKSRNNSGFMARNSGLWQKNPPKSTDIYHIREAKNPPPIFDNTEGLRKQKANKYI
jgi:hypothetical protein